MMNVVIHHNIHRNVCMGTEDVFRFIALLKNTFCFSVATYVLEWQLPQWNCQAMEWNLVLTQPICSTG